MSHGRWSLLLVRRGGGRSRTRELGPRKAALLAASALLIAAAVAFGAGWWWGGMEARARARALEAEAERLAADNARVVDLAARLAEMEESYREIREVMGADVAASDADVLLPALPAAVRGSAGVGGAGAADVPDVWPLADMGFVTRAFGDTIAEPYAGHVGMDIAVPSGSYVRASGAGVVTAAGEDPEYGRYVRIRHGGGLSSLYAHNSWLFVAAGDSVAKAEVIALSGNTGRSTAPHLHLEIERNGEPVDPMELLAVGETPGERTAARAAESAPLR